MNYIQQAYKGQLGYWKYVLFASIFFGFMGLNFLAIYMFELDVEAEMRKSIEENGKNRTFIELLLPFAFLLGALFLWVKYAHKQNITSLTTSREKIDWKRVLFSFGIWGGITILMTAGSYFVLPNEIKLNFNLVPFLQLAAVAILLVPIQTSFEEYFFRGYLMQGIGAKFKSKLFPLLFTSIMFGLMHYANPEVEKLGNLIMVYYIGTGLFLGIITLMDEGLELALGFHCANNLITALLITSDWTAFQTDSIFKDFSTPELVFSTFIPVFIIYPLLLFIFAKKYKWGNWKNHLLGKVESIDNELQNNEIDQIGE